jgi:hypothetical protein
MKFILLVEGHAERKAVPTFLKKWLDSKLSKPVGIKAVRHDGWGEMIKDAPTKAKLHGDALDVIGVIGLLDLYGPTIYPPDKLTVSAKYEWLKTKLEREVNHTKFRQFFAVHELEAWILGAAAILPLPVRNALPASAKNPERVNFNEPPKKLLKRLYSEKLNRNYKETTDSPALFGDLDPSECYAKCPYLRLMLDEMLQLAKDVGL